MTRIKRIEIKNLNKNFHSSKKGLPFTQRIIDLFSNRDKNLTKVLTDVNLTIYDGEFVGVIGKNGSGKSTLLKLIMGAIEPNPGSEIITNGKIIRLALGMGFDPNLSAKDNIYLNGTILGLSFKKIGEKFHEIIEFAELEDFIDTPIKFFSSGMKSRLSFAVALHAEADILLIDEFFGDVGDESFKAKSQKAFEENILKGKTIIHVSHSLDLLLNCDKVIIIKSGKANVYDDPKFAIKAYTEIE